MARELHKMEPKYEVYVRLPFNRGDFVDPPPVSTFVCVCRARVFDDGVCGVMSLITLPG